MKKCPKSRPNISYKLLVEPMEAAHKLATMLPQKRACVECLYLLQVGHGWNNWMPEELVAEWVQNFFHAHANTKQDPWRIFRYYLPELSDFIQVRDEG